MKCALPECEKEASYRTLCCCVSHSRRLGGLVRKGSIPKTEKPIIDPIKRGKGRVESKPYALWPDEAKSKRQSYLQARRKKRDKSMPAWADKKQIDKFYFRARQLTEATGIPHEVDHIIPSNHPLVCGLHIETNLQILTKSENRKKSNNFGESPCHGLPR